MKPAKREAVVRDAFEGRDTISESQLVQNVTQAAKARWELRHGKKCYDSAFNEIRQRAALFVYSFARANGQLPTFDQALSHTTGEKVKANA